MTAYSGQVPETLRPVDWRAAGLCAAEDPELFHPVGSSAAALQATEEAKAICRRCPSIEACLAYALDTPIHDGVWGGLSEKERRSIHRAKVRGRGEDVIAKQKEQARRPPKQPRTMQSIYDDSTTLLYGDHYAWVGPTEIRYKTRKYSPKQLSFTLERGRYPEGKVLTNCGVPRCATGRHLTDAADRATRPARATA